MLEQPGLGSDPLNWSGREWGATFMIGLEILMELGAQEVHIIGDSQLLLRQLTWVYKRNNLLLAPYYTTSTHLLDAFHSVDFEYVPRESN